jgi:hypothetical protein
MQEYAGICIGAYFAYFAYICIPHFADEDHWLRPQRRCQPDSADSECDGPSQCHWHRYCANHQRTSLLGVMARIVTVLDVVPRLG